MIVLVDYATPSHFDSTSDYDLLAFKNVRRPIYPLDAAADR